jgi:hypothetical protein
MNIKNQVCPDSSTVARVLLCCELTLSLVQAFSESELSTSSESKMANGLSETKGILKN